MRTRKSAASFATDIGRTGITLLEHDNAAAAARRAAARFDWSTPCTQTLDVYRRVLGA